VVASFSAAGFLAPAVVFAVERFDAAVLEASLVALVAEPSLLAVERLVVVVRLLEPVTRVFLSAAIRSQTLAPTHAARAGSRSGPAGPDKLAEAGNALREELGMADYANDVLVSTDWVAEHLNDDSIRIVEVDENPALYAEAHIPGAIGFDWRNDLQDQVKRDFLGPQEFGELMGSRGISNDHTIVLYGDRNNWFAA